MGREVPVPEHHDPTVCSPTEQKLIEEYYGFSTKDTDPEALRFIVERCKEAGNAAFKQKDYKEAVKMYTQAVAGAESDHTLFSNRSAAYLALGLYEQALWDANKCTTLKPDWAKGYYRQGCAYLAFSQWEAAAAALQRGAELDPRSSETASKLAEAREHAQQEASARRAQAATERRALVFKLRAARKEDRRLAALNQYKQSMTAPDWELDDLEWRPTFLPYMKLKPISQAAVLRDPKRRLLVSYLGALADLAHPRQALALLMDDRRAGAYQQALQAAVRPGEHALVLGAGSGLLALLAAGAGAGRVTAVERSRSLYRMARQALEANAGREETKAVELVDRKLTAVGVRGEELPPDVKQAVELVKQRQQQEQAAAGANSSSVASAGGEAAPMNDREGRGSSDAACAAAGETEGEGDASAAAAAAVEEVASLLPGRASLLVTDLLDYSVLGMGLLPAIDHAARYLLTPAARVVHAMLLELQLGETSGFDLSPLDTYRWYPHHERVRLDRVPHRVLSAPFALHTLDLQARVDALTNSSASTSTCDAPKPEGGRDSGSGDSKGGSDSGSGGSSKRQAEATWEWDQILEVPVTREGTFNAVAFWFDAQLLPKQQAAAEPGGSGSAESSNETSSWANGGSTWGGGGSGGSSGGEAVVVSSFGQGRAGGVAASSWEQAVQYVDSVAVSKGATLSLRVRQDSGQYVFTTAPPQCRPHHALVPRWHYDMVQDTLRNDAYDQAIRRAVARKKDMGLADVLALDMGAGSGILSMMTARAGAKAVYGAEVNIHMCDVGEETTIMNGFLGRVMLLDRDVRRMDTLRKPDGTPPELPRRADLAVYEVFDSGLIGEGILHLLFAAKHKLLQADAALVPLSATVYCQPIQMRVGDVAGWDMQQANRYWWRPDYEGIELAQCRERWVALAEPQEVFHFNFYEADRNMQPASNQLLLKFNKAGVFNAVAMWFELHLDEETQLSTSPYLEKGPTWQQAVQHVQEVRTEPGQTLKLTASHDTYSISYSRVDNEEELLVKQSTGVPMKDPGWDGAHSQLQELNGQLVKACVQNPLEYRAVAEAAVLFAARPHDLGLDVQQATEFCARMMG
ncbi:hypothetical protein N2152v2_011180 [Parachlorella kessleri]